jgi:hypothetical protein
LMVPVLSIDARKPRDVLVLVQTLACILDADPALRKSA